jgi:hypothetical protein
MEHFFGGAFLMLKIKEVMLNGNRNSTVIR